MHGEKTVIVGSKNFTESVILGELQAQKLEKAGCKVDRRLNLGGSLVCDAAIADGSLDTYVEYSGTAGGTMTIQSNHAMPGLQIRDTTSGARSGP